MPARLQKTLMPERGHYHRVHRSKRSLKGLNATHKRIDRLMRLQIQKEYEKEYLKRFFQLKTSLVSGDLSAMQTELYY